ncbi:MAG: homogentisate phytyltransferase [Bacteroidota bacterium]
MEALLQFIRFSRLHTIVGTSLSIVVLYLIALSFSDYSDWHLDLLALTLISCLGANIYIVGLNQITDVEIDRINKPYLPLASGYYSIQQGWWIVGISVALSLIIALYVGQYLLWTVVLSLILGTSYSLPPIRLKRFTFWAAFCIIAVRGLIVNTLLFLNFHSQINGQHQLPMIIILLTISIFVLSIIIAWFKDIPDMEGDQLYKIRTLTLRFGARRVLLWGNLMISLLYLFLMLSALFGDLQLNPMVLIASHALLLIALWLGKYQLNLKQKRSIQRYYQFIWVLFFLEYLSFAGASLWY